MKKFWTILGIVLVVMIAGLQFAPRTIVSHADYPEFASVDDITTRSDAVIVGRILDLRADKDSLIGDNYLIVTFATVEVIEQLSGVHVPQQITVKQMGGTVGSTTFVEAGTAPLVRNQKRVLFLAKMIDGTYMPLNPKQGSMPILAGDTVEFGGKSYKLDDFSSEVRMSR